MYVPGADIVSGLKRQLESRLDRLPCSQRFCVVKQRVLDNFGSFCYFLCPDHDASGIRSIHVSVAPRLAPLAYIYTLQSTRHTPNMQLLPLTIAALSTVR